MKETGIQERNEDRKGRERRKKERERGERVKPSSSLTLPSHAHYLDK